MRAPLTLVVIVICSSIGCATSTPIPHEQLTEALTARNEAVRHGLWFADAKVAALAAMKEQKDLVRGKETEQNARSVAEFSALHTQLSGQFASDWDLASDQYGTIADRYNALVDLIKNSLTSDPDAHKATLEAGIADVQSGVRTLRQTKEAARTLVRERLSEAARVAHDIDGSSRVLIPGLSDVVAGLAQGVIVGASKAVIEGWKASEEVAAQKREEARLELDKLKMAASLELAARREQRQAPGNERGH